MGMTSKERHTVMDFTVWMPAGGYTRAKNSANKWYLVRRAPPDEAVREDRLYPLADEGRHEVIPLFRRFAELPLDWEAMLAFANAYGRLGIDEGMTRVGETTVEPGEPVQRWRREILDMRHATDVWMWLHQNDQTALRRAFELDEAGQHVWFVERKWRELVVREDTMPDLWRAVHPSQLYAARAYLLRKFEAKFEGAVLPGFMLDAKRQLQPSLRPRHLLGAMWWQLYEAICGERRVIRCRYCARWMDVTRHRGTKQAHAACVHRAKTYRARWGKRRQEIQKLLNRRAVPAATRTKLQADLEALEKKLRRLEQGARRSTRPFRGEGGSRRRGGFASGPLQDMRCMCTSQVTWKYVRTSIDFYERL